MLSQAYPLQVPFYHGYRAFSTAERVLFWRYCVLQEDANVVGAFQVLGGEAVIAFSDVESADFSNETIGLIDDVLSDFSLLTFEPIQPSAGIVFTAALQGAEWVVAASTAAPPLAIEDSMKNRACFYECVRYFADDDPLHQLDASLLSIGTIQALTTNVGFYGVGAGWTNSEAQATAFLLENLYTSSWLAAAPSIQHLAARVQSNASSADVLSGGVRVPTPVVAPSGSSATSTTGLSQKTRKARSSI